MGGGWGSVSVQGNAWGRNGNALLRECSLETTQISLTLAAQIRLQKGLKRSQAVWERLVRVCLVGGDAGTLPRGKLESEAYGGKCMGRAYWGGRVAGGNVVRARRSGGGGVGGGYPGFLGGETYP